MKNIAMVNLDEYGAVYCGNCSEDIVCDENGDMPDTCKSCGYELDWSEFDTNNN